MACERPETETIEGAIDVQLTRLDRLGRDHPGRTVAIVSGGEVNCAIGDDAGIGGRNQALAIALAEQIDRSPIAFLAAGTDGIDGNSTAAGAVVDGQTASRARERGIDLADARTRFDSHTALDALGATIVTGPTGNNVRDVRMLVRVG